MMDNPTPEQLKAGEEATVRIKARLDAMITEELQGGGMVDAVAFISVLGAVLASAIKRMPRELQAATYAGVMQAIGGSLGIHSVALDLGPLVKEALEDVKEALADLGHKPRKPH